MRTRLVCLLWVVCAGAGLFAHHSYADFDRTREVSIEGTLEELMLVNPHAILMVRTQEGTLFTAEWGNVSMLMRTGFHAGMLTVGDHVIVTGSPTKNADLHRVSLLTRVTRPRDAWEWSRAGVVPAAPPR